MQDQVPFRLRGRLPWLEEFTNTVPPTGFELHLCRDAPERAKSVSGAGNTDFTYRTLSQVHSRQELTADPVQTGARLWP